MIKTTLNDVIFNNIMFIGDPHLRSENISKRNDDSIMDTIIKKLEDAAEISHSKKCYTVILGDLFDFDNENSIELLTKTIRVFNKFYYKPITIIGNHEKTESTIVDKNMITSLIEAGVLDIIKKNEISAQIEMQNPNSLKTEQIEIGGTPYGFKIPTKVSEKSKKTKKIIWVTHHDLMFKNYYPNSLPLNAIDGVCLAVNGHMHKPQNEVQVKLTTWCCPGNITRLSKDCAEQVPSVWLWDFEHHDNSKIKLIQQPLKYTTDIFRKEVIIESTIKNNFIIPDADDKKFKFIELAELSNDLVDNNKTSDKDLLSGYIDNLFSVYNAPDEIKNEVLELFNSLED